MKSECNIVRDLLPLCIEDMASPDSAVFVGKHLEKCEDCRREMNRLQTPDLPGQTAPDPAEAEALFALNEKIKRRNRILVTVRTIVSTFILCTLLIGLIVYHLPQRRRVTMPVCNADGEVSTLEIDVKYYRRLFSIPWVKGTATFDGVTYRDVSSRLGRRQQDGYSFWDWVWYFGDPDSVIPANTFFQKEAHDPDKLFQDQIYLYYVGEENTFDTVFFYYIQYDESSSQKYFGPASTIEQARQLVEAQGWLWDVD